MRLDQFRVIADKRKRIKELQPKAQQRKIAKVLGVDETTVRRDLGTRAANAAPADMTGTAAARLVAKRTKNVAEVRDKRLATIAELSKGNAPAPPVPLMLSSDLALVVSFSCSAGGGILMRTIAAAIAIAFPITCNAQEPTREATFDYLSSELAEIQQDARELQAYSSNKSYLQERIDDLLKRAASVRDYLAGNPYIRVSGVSVTIPWGVTFEFSFPEGNEADQQ